MPSPARLILLPAALALLVGCGPPAEVARYQTATLEPGKGLGDLRLGQLTLVEAVSRFGAERVAILASDSYGFELVLADGGLALLFMTGEDDACKHAANKLGAREMSRDLRGLLDAEPACRGLALAGISVREGFYEGRTPQGVGMGDGLVASAPGPIEDIGLGTAMPRYNNAGTPGIVFHSDREPGEEDAPIVMMSVHPVID